MAKGESHVALVLGAGASMAYGYPSGRTLRHLILDMPLPYAREAGIVRERYEESDQAKLRHFQNDFRASQMYSIDAFLGRRSEYVDIGKRCIAAALMRCENLQTLFSEEQSKDHWYQYFLNRQLTNDWKDLDFSDIAIISFNYDRSLEHYLMSSLKAAYNKPDREVIDKLKSLRIVHVYGTLGQVLPDENYYGYDGKVVPEKVDAAANDLIVIPEGRTNSPRLELARKWLSDAYAIAFLGFGFDSINVERLAAEKACRLWQQRQDGQTQRNICGTCMGLTKTEARRAYFALADDDESVDLFDMDCTSLLRSTLILG